MHEIPSSTFSLDNWPAIGAPIAIPMAVNRNIYPPPISDKFKDCMAKGIIFICTKPPKNRKKLEPNIAGNRYFLL